MDKEKIKNDIKKDYPKRSSYKRLLERLINGRRILIWGAYERSREIVEFIENMELKGFLEGGYIDSNKEIEKYNDKKCHRPEEINAETDFIIFALLNRYEEINELLEERGFFEQADYLYFFEMKNPNITISQCSGYYCDIYGNEIQGNFEGINIHFIGTDNFLYIGESCKFKDGIEINIINGSSVIIADNVNIVGKDFEILAENDAFLYFGENCYLCDSYILVKYHSVVKISENFSCVKDLKLGCDQNTLLYIGKDCMFSFNVSLLCHDGHNIYDLEKHKNINKNKNYGIIIGDHVWVGFGVTILYGAKIGSGSLIGINSFVNKEFQNNAIIAGNPAKAIRENIAWDRTIYPFIDDEEKFKEFDFRKK